MRPERAPIGLAAEALSELLVERPRLLYSVIELLPPAITE
jgi:hypothetical protein